jgi:hypothetical protein
MAMSDRVRPGVLRWLRYAFGAGLPERHRTWVLHDVTSPTWVIRHLVRSALQIAPFAVAVYFVIPGEPAIRLTGIAMGATIGILYSLAFVEAMAEHRAVKAGYPEGTAAAVRDRRRHPERAG